MQITYSKTKKTKQNIHFILAARNEDLTYLYVDEDDTTTKEISNPDKLFEIIEYDHNQQQAFNQTRIMTKRSVFGWLDFLGIGSAIRGYVEKAQ